MEFLRLASLSLLATLGIVFQNIFHIEGWIFYLLFTSYLLFVKSNGDLFKLAYTYSLGILLAIGIWEGTGVFLNVFHNLAVAMSIVTFIAIFLVLFVKRYKAFNLSAVFFIDLIAYFGIAEPPSVTVITKILQPSILGLVAAFTSSQVENFFKRKEETN